MAVIIHVRRQIASRIALDGREATGDHGLVDAPSSSTGPRLQMPDALVANHVKYFGDSGRAWIAALPQLAADCLERWALRPDGPPICGGVALVLPVVLADGTRAVLKLQPIDDETVGEPTALRTWDGRGAVRLLRHDPRSGSMLLERLSAERSLAAVPDDLVALRTLSEILGRLNAIPAPAGMRRLTDIATDMLDRVPPALAMVPDPSQRGLIRRCADAVTELLPSADTQLLHWDLHYENVLGRDTGEPDDRGHWLAIDPKPLAGDPCFDIFAALHNRWDDVVATGDVPRAIRRRFDLMTDLLGLDRQRAAGWTLGRVLQNALWDIEKADTTWHTGPDRAVAQVLFDSYWPAPTSRRGRYHGPMTY